VRRRRPGAGGTVRTLSLVDRYLELAFRLGKHEPELVESYYGPPDPAAAVEAEDPLAPARLADDARSLLDDLERSDLPPQRRSWLAAQTRALLTVALLYERGASVDEAREYARKWSLQPEERVEKMLGSVHERAFPGYVHCYPEGLRLCAAFVGGDPKRFKRLLVEQLVPDDLG
jgi:hypothetical protein